MKMKSVQVRNFKSIDDTGEFPIDAGVTALVGKNESGKTACLQAVRRLNPVDGAEFDPTRHYPRQRLTKYRRVHDAEPAVVVRAVFELSPSDVAAAETLFCSEVVTSTEVVVTKGYDNVLVARLEVDEERQVRFLGDEDGLDPRAVEACRTASSLVDLRDRLIELEESPSVDALRRRVEGLVKAPFAELVWRTALLPRMPKFMYFDEFFMLSGHATLAELQAHLPKRDQDFEGDAQRARLSGLTTLLDLLDLAAVEPADLDPDGTDYEDYKANLEAAALDITSQIFDYWSQNDGTEVDFDVDSEKRFRVRVKGRHRISIPFEECSKGFIWFFSFLARFNRIASQHESLVLLLDEPGLNLHASAQEDLLRLIEERLVSAGHQVIYSTHSPFMIASDKLPRVRTVEDQKGKGTVVSEDVLVADPATAFPLQAALGYSLAQTLFLGPKVLLVEGPSDVNFLWAISAYLGSQGKTTLDEDWVVTPVGGSGRLAAFVTLLGSNKLKVAVLMDFAAGDQQVLSNILKSRVIKKKSVITPAEILDCKEADIEDLLGAEVYVPMVRKAFPDKAAALKSDALPERGTLVKSVGAAMGEDRFNHYTPSTHIQWLLDEHGLPDDVQSHFEEVFRRVNALG